MKCKTLGERGRGGEAFERERGKRNHTCKRIQLTAQSLTSETSEYVWKHCECRKSAGLLSAALQCVFHPTAACITEHMFSTQELKQKRLFVIIHSFVYICPPPPSVHPLFSNQTKALVETLTARESEARMPSRDPSPAPAPRPRELLSSQWQEQQKGTLFSAYYTLGVATSI